MPKFKVLVLPIDSVENHPSADRLSINRIRGYTLVSNKLEDGSHRYKPGQLVQYIPRNTYVPEYILKQGYWDEANNHGLLGGEHHNLVEPILLRKVLSDGLIVPVEMMNDQPYVVNVWGDKRLAQSGANVAEFIGVSRQNRSYAALVVPKDNTPVHEIVDPQRFDYEFEDLKMFPDALKGKQVVVTELLHGIGCVIGFDRRLGEDPFFVADADYFRAYNLQKDKDNIYTQTAKPIWEEIKRYLIEMPSVEKFYIFGVIVGPGIQDLTYGLETTEFRGTDIWMGVMGGGPDTIPDGYLDYMKKVQLFKWLNIAMVPMLGAGDFDSLVISELEKGPSLLGGGLRKGIVINAEDESLINGMRPAFSLLSHKFLLRKKGTNWK